jgi:N-acetylglucosamine-6-sulfatase
MTDSIVMVVIDDTPDNVPQYMSQYASLCSDGVNFTNHFVSSPLCSPSRAATMTGKYGHNNGVTSNDWPNGGYGKAYDLEPISIFKIMHDAGYYVAVLGKYQNHYLPGGNADPSKGATYPALHVPTGVDYAFLVDSGGYAMFEYTATLKIGGGAASLVDTNGGTKAEADYITDVIQGHLIAAIIAAAAAGKPLFAYVAPFATHSGGAGSDPQHLKFVPSPRARAAGPGRPVYWGSPDFTNGDCGNPSGGGCMLITTAARPGDISYNAINENATAWHRTTIFTDAEIATRTGYHILQAQQAQGIDDMIIAMRAQLATSGLAASTWIMMQSDNGGHLGEHCFEGFKSTPFDHDTKTTFVIRPPGGTTGRDETAIVQNVDFSNTCRAIAGIAEDTTLDGRSLVPFVTGTPPDPADWRAFAFIKCDADNFSWTDAQGTGEAPAFNGLRDDHYLYADFDPEKEVSTGAPVTSRGELYVLDDDPWATSNQYPFVVEDSRDDLDGIVQAILAASGTTLWNLLKIPIPALVFGESILDQSQEAHLVFDDIEYHKPPQYWMQSSTSHPQAPSKYVPLSDIPDINGLDPAGQATLNASQWACTLRVTDMNEAGAHGGWATYDENLQDVYIETNTRKLVTVGYARGGPVAWQFKGRVAADITPRPVEGSDDEHPQADLPILWNIPAGCRRGLNYRVWTRSLAADLDNEIIDIVSNSTVEINDAFVRIRGGFTEVDVMDKETESGYTFAHPDERATPGSRDITSDEYVIFDTEHRKAYLGVWDPDQTDSWDTSGLPEVSGGINSYGANRNTLPITPFPGGSGPGVGVRDPRNRIAKIDVVVTYAGDRTTTEISIRLKEARS